MKNVYRKNITIYDIYKLQKLITFYYDKKIESTTNKIIKIIKTIQVQNSIHLKKRQNKRFKQKKLYKKNSL